MKIIFNEYEEKQFKEYAEGLGVSVEAIKEVYTGMVDSNFDQDLSDAILENKELLEKDYK